MGRIIPYIMENKTCLKPPTSIQMGRCSQWVFLRSPPNSLSTSSESVLLSISLPLSRWAAEPLSRWAAGQIRILNGQTMCNSMLDMLRCYICYHTWGKNAVYISIFIIFYYIPLEALMSQAWLKIRADPAVLHQLRMSLNATTRRIIRIHPS